MKSLAHFHPNNDEGAHYINIVKCIASMWLMH